MTVLHTPRTGRQVLVTETVKPHERALAIAETNHLTDDYRELHRWQFIYVNRGDEVAEWHRDLGPASRFAHCSEFRIFSFWEDEVAELMDQATAMRFEAAEFRERLLEQQQSSTLIPDYLNMVEERRKQAANQSTFGPGFNRQRNLFARTQV